VYNSVSRSPAGEPQNTIDAAGGPARVPSPVQSCLERLHERYAALTDGEIATYIPELAKANPEWFGICVATTDGHVYEVGDSRQQFTIQSISKPFAYGLALEDNGVDAVFAKIGVEPTGDAFNAISLTPGTGRPFNPLINAGAITATSLLAGHSSADKLSRLAGQLSLYAGRPLTIDATIYESERATGHRNRAIGHMLRNFGILAADPDPVLDLYFQQCSVEVTCRDLSLMAATLANGGVNPLTGERAVREQVVPSILSVMTTCGMYDYAGEWVYHVGLPAKSGVAGGILAVLPGQLGIGVFSPRLDARGNSVRGIAVCRDLSQECGLHFLRVARSSLSALRAHYSLTAARSKRRRSAADRAVLDRLGDRARVYELQGDLVFSAVEAVVRRLVDHSAATDFAILDMRRVTRVDEAAARILIDLWVNMAACGRLLLFAHAHEQSSLLRAVEECGVHLGTGRPRAFPDIDSALEWCEDQLLRAARGAAPSAAAIPLADHEICRGLDARALADLERLLERKRFARGESIVRAGETAQAMYLLLAGQASVVIELPSGQLKRLATLAPGMAFGELAIISRSARSADIRADEAVDCLALSADTFEELGRSHPAIKLTLLENLLRQAYDTVSRLNRELAALGG
jgi:glutaminase